MAKYDGFHGYCMECRCDHNGKFPDRKPILFTIGSFHVRLCNEHAGILVEILNRHINNSTPETEKD